MEPFTLISQYILHRDQFEIIHGHQPENALFIVQKGSFSFSFKGGQTQIAKEGDFVFFPQKARFERHIINPIDFHLVYFRLNLQDPYSNLIPSGIVNFKDKARQESNHRIFDALVTTTNDLATKLKEHALNDVFLQYLFESVPEVSLSKEQEDALVDKAMKYISEHYKEKININDLANLYNSSVSSLNRSFKQRTGQSPIEYLIGYKIRIAKYYLTFTSKSINAIADLCGYENIYYFSNTFRKICNCSPSQYRKQLPKI